MNTKWFVAILKALRIRLMTIYIANYHCN